MRARIDELHAYTEELIDERDALGEQLEACLQRGEQQRARVEQLTRDIARTGRELARVQGMLRRYQREHAAPADQPLPF